MLPHMIALFLVFFKETPMLCSIVAVPPHAPREILFDLIVFGMKCKKAVCAGSVSFCVVLNYKRKGVRQVLLKQAHGQMRSYSGSSIPSSRQPLGEDGGRTRSRQAGAPPPPRLPCSLHLPWQHPPTPGAHSLLGPRPSPQQGPKAEAPLAGNCTSPAGGTGGGPLSAQQVP